MEKEELMRQVAQYTSSPEFIAIGQTVGAEMRTALETQGFTVGELQSTEVAGLRGHKAQRVAFNLSYAGAPEGLFENALFVRVTGEPLLCTVVNIEMSEKCSKRIRVNRLVFGTASVDPRRHPHLKDALLESLLKVTQESSEEWLPPKGQAYAQIVSKELSM